MIIARPEIKHTISGKKRESCAIIFLVENFRPNPYQIKVNCGGGMLVGFPVCFRNYGILEFTPSWFGFVLKNRKPPRTLNFYFKYDPEGFIFGSGLSPAMFMTIFGPSQAQPNMPRDNFQGGWGQRREGQQHRRGYFCANRNVIFWA